jgi:hypothetical protein
VIRDIRAFVESHEFAHIRDLNTKTRTSGEKKETSGLAVLPMQYPYQLFGKYARLFPTNHTGWFRPL